MGPGFDVFGLALDAFSDRVAVRRGPGRGVSVRVAPGGEGGAPAGASRNTAGVVAARMAGEFGLGGRLEVTVQKGVPVGLGLGSSAASAAAAAVAVDRLFGLRLGLDDLVRLAGEGERAAAGAVHYDNAAASVAGGFVIVRGDPPSVTRLEPPRGLAACVAIPDVRVPAAKTRAARGAVPARARMADCTSNVANAAAMAAGFASGDAALACGAAADAIVEPARRRAIPGYDGVRRGALGAGALGVAISGAGPSMIAFAAGRGNLPAIGRAMERGFAGAGVRCRTVRCGPAAAGARRRRA